MRLFILTLFLLTTGCVTSQLDMPLDQGISCYRVEKEGEKDTEVCIESDTYIDPVKWHYLRSYERERMGDMPDLN